MDKEALDSLENEFFQARADEKAEQEELGGEEDDFQESLTPEIYDQINPIK